MFFYGNTDVGLVRNANQDNFMAGKYSDEMLFAVVCDGMGGVSGGSIASTLASNAFNGEISAAEKEHPAFMGLDDESITEILKEAVQKANRTVKERASEGDGYEGMGTTLVACIIANGRGYAVNVGDSRLYLVKGEEIIQVSHDHSYVQYLVDIGSITQEEAKVNKNKNIITRAVGTDDNVDPDVFRFDVVPGDKVLLCSDGLSNLVEDGEILTALREVTAAESAQKACEWLIETAKSRGGFDNITAVILSV